MIAVIGPGLQVQKSEGGSQVSVKLPGIDQAIGLMVKVRLLAFWPDRDNRGLTPAGWAVGVVESVEGEEVSGLISGWGLQIAGQNSTCGYELAIVCVLSFSKH